MTDPALTRRRALTGAAVGGLSLPLLAACGGGGSGSTPVAQPGSSESTGDSSNSTLLTTASAVPVGGGVILGQQNVVVTQPSKGEFAGFSATCTHQGCILATVSAGTINCGCHGSKFRVADGSVAHGPATRGLTPVGVTVDGTDVKLA